MFLTKQRRHWLSWPQGETCITALALQQIMHCPRQSGREREREREREVRLVVTVYLHLLSPSSEKDVESLAVHFRDVTVRGTGPNLGTGQRPVKTGPGPVPAPMCLMSNLSNLWDENGAKWLKNGVVYD